MNHRHPTRPAPGSGGLWAGIAWDVLSTPRLRPPPARDEVFIYSSTWTGRMDGYLAETDAL